MRSFLLYLGLAIIAMEVFAIQEAAFDQGDINAYPGFGALSHVNVDRIYSAESSDPESREARLRFERLRTLPIMKKSIAIGRAGFRPGKRTVDIFSAF